MDINNIDNLCRMERQLNGGVRWARQDELMSMAHMERLSSKDDDFKGGLPLISDGDTVYLDSSDAHSLIIGSTGSKKTRLFAMPMLELFMRAGESVIVTDPKGELYDLTAGAFQKRGYRIHVINLRDPLRSNGWNPLAQARACRVAGNNERATAIINDFANSILPTKHGTKADPFWEQTSRAMLQGLLHMIIEGEQFIPHSYVNLMTLRHFSAKMDLNGGYDDPCTLELLDEYPATSMARLNLEAIIRGSEKTFDNIKVSYDAPMQQLYIQQSLIQMLSVDEINFADYGNRKSVLFLIMPDEKTTLHSIVSLVIKQCYEQLITAAQTAAKNSLPIRVNFLLDEFSNLPAIPDMSAMISAGRSRNIRFTLIIQGLYQLNSKYGPDDAQTITGNCGNWVFLTSRELPLLQEISDLCGTDALTGERLISVSQLQRLNKDTGEVLMLIGRQYPFIAHLPDIERYILTQAPRRPLPILRTDGLHAMTIKMALANIQQKSAS